MKKKIAIKVNDRFQSEAVQKMNGSKFIEYGDGRYPVYVLFYEPGQTRPGWVPIDKSDEIWCKRGGYTILDFDTNGAKIREFFAEEPETCLACGQVIETSEHDGVTYHQCPKKVPFDSVCGLEAVFEENYFFVRGYNPYADRLDLSFTKQMIREAFEYYFKPLKLSDDGVGYRKTGIIRCPVCREIKTKPGNSCCGVTDDYEEICRLTPAEIEKLFYEKCVGDELVGDEKIDNGEYLGLIAEQFCLKSLHLSQHEDTIVIANAKGLVNVLNRWIKQNKVKK